MRAAHYKTMIALWASYERRRRVIIKRERVHACMSEPRADCSARPLRQQSGAVARLDFSRRLARSMISLRESDEFASQMLKKSNKKCTPRVRRSPSECVFLFKNLFPEAGAFFVVLLAERGCKLLRELFLLCGEVLRGIHNGGDEEVAAALAIDICDALAARCCIKKRFAAFRKASKASYKTKNQE